MKKQSFSPKLSSYDSPKTKEQRMKNTTYGKIPTEWEISLLKDACIKKSGVQTGPFGSQLHQKDYKQVGTPIITVEHLGENRIIHENLPLVSDEDLDRLNRYTLKEGDIVFSRVGSVDRRAFVKKDEEGWLFSGRCLRVRPNPKIVDPSYLSWFFGHPNFKEYIRRIAVGATMPSLNTDLLESVEVILPSLNEQKNIASILDSLNEKIELNRQMNSTLEQIAQALFKRWFIDFEFPDENGKPYRSSGGRMVDSELGEIPEGWGVKSLYDCAQYINGAAFKSKDFSDNQEGLPIIKISELKNGITSQTKFTTKKMDQKYRITNGEILFSWSGSPDTSIDIFLWTEGEGWLNQHTFRIIPQKADEKEFIFFLLKKFKSDFIEIARNKQTTGLGHVTSKDLKNMYIPFPPQEITKLFRDVAGPIFNQIYYNSLEYHNLSNIRDLLLPKLISGKIRVQD